MKMILGIPAWAVILILLLLVNLGWISWNWHYNADIRVAAKQFKIEVLHTNNISGVGIVEAKTGKPLWIEWDYTTNGEEFSYFFHGTNIFNLNLWKGKPLAYDVGFHGLGKSSVWWWDLGRGTFIQRNFFNTNGDFSKAEVWYNEAWHTVDRRNEHNGVIINGQWHQLAFDTNGMWTIEAT